MKIERQITFVSNNPDAYVEECTALTEQGIRRFLLRPFNDQASAFYDLMQNRLTATDIENIQFFAADIETGINLPENVNIESQAPSIQATVLFCNHKRQVSSTLLDYLDMSEGRIIAPIISIHSSLRSLFLISIPKSGTHLLYELASALGYTAGVYCPEQPDPQNWYCLQGTNSHTEAKDFLLESAKHHYFAQRNHPFAETPTLMIYRNPLDIVVSEANYYHKPENTVFTGYLSHLNFEQRLEKLVNDPWLMGSIRDRISAFIPWLAFRNVIPVSFEELIGEQGGGNNQKQQDLIWSLLLKLHISGKPTELAKKVFNTESATFHHGRLGSHKEKFTKHAYELFSALSQDFMVELGYPSPEPSLNTKVHTSQFSSRIEEFRKRPLQTSRINFENVPICAKHNFNGHNIIKFRNTFIAIPILDGEKDLNNISNEFLNKYPQHNDIQKLKSILGSLNE